MIKKLNLSLVFYAVLVTANYGIKKIILGLRIAMRNALSDFSSICSAEALRSLTDLITDPQVSATELQRPSLKAGGSVETPPDEFPHRIGAAIPASNRADQSVET